MTSDPIAGRTLLPARHPGTGPGHRSMVTALTLRWRRMTVKRVLAMPEDNALSRAEENRVMLRAIYRGQVLAEAPRTVRVEGNHYFPPDSLHREYLVESPTKTLCPWKGVARYYAVLTEKTARADAAWYYPHPTPLARRIRNHVAFGPEVRIEGEPEGPPAGLLARLRSLLTSNR